MINTYMKKCSLSLIFRELQIKITMKYHSTVVRMTFIMKITDNGEDTEKVNTYTLLVEI